jgi:hypothetical protein
MSKVYWRKSSLSANDGQCVEVGVWAKSSLSGPWTDACVEVAGGADLEEILVRDTKDKGEGPILHFNRAEWEAFLGGVLLGEFDLPA